MNCKKCGAEIKANANFCEYCGSTLTTNEGEKIYFQIDNLFTIQARGFFVQGKPLLEIKANDTLTNSRTKQTYCVLYVASPKGKMLKQSKNNEICLLNLQGANRDDFQIGDMLVK